MKNMKDNVKQLKTCDQRWEVGYWDGYFKAAKKSNDASYLAGYRVGRLDYNKEKI